MEERSHQPFLPFVVQLLILLWTVLALSVLSLAGLFLLPNVPVPCEDQK